MKECGWKIYVHQHFFFSPNNNHLPPKMMVDLGENRMAAGRKNQSIHPSINHILQPTWQKGAKLQKISVKERLKRLEAQREAARKRIKAVKYAAKNSWYCSDDRIRKYISIEKAIADTKEAYYDALQKADQGWHEENNDPKPFIKYMCAEILSWRF